MLDDSDQKVQQLKLIRSRSSRTLSHQEVAGKQAQRLCFVYLRQPQVTINNCVGLPINLPPLNEQKRIVAKVDQLLALGDGLETRLLIAQTDCDRLIEAAVAEILAA